LLFFFAVDVVQNLVCELKMHSTYFHQDFQNTVSPLLLTSLMMKNAYTVSVDSVCHSSAALLHTDFSGSTWWKWKDTVLYWDINRFCICTIKWSM